MLARSFLAVLAFAAVASQATAQTGLSEADRIYGLSTFWKEVDYNFAFFDQVPDLDWDSAYVALLPEAMAAQDTFAYFRVLQKAVALLDDGHTNVYLPEDFDIGRYVAAPAIQLQAIGHRAIVAERGLGARGRRADRVRDPDGGRALGGRQDPARRLPLLQHLRGARPLDGRHPGQLPSWHRPSRGRAGL